ncbi:hypothetical protein BU26DRAFT_547286 [Trematosphaeria pertusa]|uniref:Uncharacterized protein n=1 Tax=Trematosphaeria pertusa TaxID=390896 RepID=A0A6A6IYD4_9PLEO|nr:uncharacterized protein BU26DRAFT_547286 [Trematosphaeria pertusa]KAF2255318.1 hypothetical protein BU26DRAFT_547286 [Trematosphaeria pertusa]
MALRSPTTTILPPALLILAILPILVSAQGETGGNRIDSGQCPNNTEATMVYSPFKPYFTWWHGDVQKCWVAADCLFEAAGESRKQQFAATALVMGLIPLTLKDIAWPERRLIHVTKSLNWAVEILVLALGLVPLETDNAAETKRKSRENNMIAKKAWGLGRGGVVLWIFVAFVGLVASYAGLVFMEIYSKRSALGCPFPVFVATWYVVALVPAAIHACFAMLRRRRHARRQLRRQQTGLATPTVKQGFQVDVQASPREEDAERKKKIISAVQGADEDWPVQMAWGIYYIAGTLIFTSIMAVTVVELICWVGLGFAVTGCSKILAFFLCLVFEETGKRGGEGVEERRVGQSGVAAGYAM